MDLYIYYLDLTHYNPILGTWKKVQLLFTFISEEGVMSFVFQPLAITNATVRIPTFD